MLMLTTEKCRRRGAGVHPKAPFQPGEVYLVRYMTTPALATVLSREGDMVTTWHGTETVEQFNERVVCLMGRRARFLGLFLPWARLQPQRVIRCDLADNTGTNTAFWQLART
jgi:hypothetical protein